MKYKERQIEQVLKKYQNTFKILSVTGPRQAGKTTLLQNVLKGFTYFNLENPLLRERIESDIEGFFSDNSSKIILDEIQNMPQLLSYLQYHVDKSSIKGEIFISGSQNLLISEKISQTLAGRAGYISLLPFSFFELDIKNNTNVYKTLLKGGYPEIYKKGTNRALYHEDYIRTYLERDVRAIKNIGSLSTFRRFIRLVAGRVGQVLNTSSLANDVGISPNTAETWLSILEASYIIFRLQPYYKNFGKRLIKSPKIYFYDTGLLCTLLNIDTISEIRSHFAIGTIFENFIILEIMKYIKNTVSSTDMYFFRDNHGNEVDLILDTGSKQIPIEIKSGRTFSSSFLKNLQYWRKHSGFNTNGFIIYAGTDNFTVKQDKVVNWVSLNEVLKDL